MITIFWILLLLITYCYFGYPIVLYFLAACFPYKSQKGPQSLSVSVILSVWNEEDVLAEKIENLLSLNYPNNQVEILIGSDGSTDQTNDIVSAISDPRIRLIESPERRGKMATINRLVELAGNEVIVFTDARQKFEQNAIRELVENFEDPKVGCVSGELILSHKQGSTARGINLYWNYEKFMRSKESRIYSMLGATGAIYAIRRDLYSQIPENVVLDDMYVPLKIIQKGFRAILDHSAKAYDEVADNPQEEYKRKARTLYGNYQIFWIFRRMFNPFTSPIALQLFSHKLLRVMIPFLMILVYLLNFSLLGRAYFDLIFIVQNIFYVMALIGAFAKNQKYGILKVVSRACYIPYVFCLLNFSAFIGFIRFAGAKQNITWEKARAQKET